MLIVKTKAPFLKIKGAFKILRLASKLQLHQLN